MCVRVVRPENADKAKKEVYMRQMGVLVNILRQDAQKVVAHIL